MKHCVIHKINTRNINKLVVLDNSLRKVGNRLVRFYRKTPVDIIIKPFVTIKYTM